MRTSSICGAATYSTEPFELKLFTQSQPGMDSEPESNGELKRLDSAQTRTCRWSPLLL